MSTATPTESRPEITAKHDLADAAAVAADLAHPAAPVKIDARGLGIAILATIGTIFALSWAQSFLIPVILAIIIAYTLNPLIAWLEVIRVPRLAATTLVMAAVVGVMVLGAYRLGGQFQSVVESLPEAARKLTAAVERLRIGQLDNMQKLQSAASAVEKAAAQAATATPTPRQPATHVVVDPPAFRLGNALWEGSLGAFGALAQAMTVIFLVFFLLIGGDRFKRKLVQLTGPTLSNKKITVNILDDINASIQKYMLMLVTTNLLVALLTWIALRWIGLENAGAWAVAAAFLHVVPYLGPAITAALAGAAAFMQFESLSSALLVAGATLGIAAFVGTFVTTWMIGRIAAMNAAAVFISLLFWGWLWGVWGMLLSVPLVVIVKVVSERIEPLHPVAELLGD